MPMDNSFRILLILLVLWKANAFDIKITPSTNIYGVKYNHIYFLCEVKNAGSSRVTISFAINGKVLLRPPPYPLNWKHGRILMIRPLFVGRSDGFYECIANDTTGKSIRKGFRLTVKEDADLPYGFPKIPVPLQPLFLTEGDTAVLPCAATGSPKPSVRWFQSHLPIEFTDPTMKVLPDNSLQIVNLTLRARGLFECEMSNSVGRRMSQRVGIFVKEKEKIKISPTLTRKQQDVTIDPESSVTLSCEATGTPKPIFSWYKNGRLQAGGTDGHLFLRRVVRSANYTCQARNGAAKMAESTSQLIVRPKPLTPSRPKFVGHTVSSITITWAKNDLEIYPITGYIIKYRIKGTFTWKEQAVKLPQMQFTYGGLRPYTFCEFQVIAVNNAGHSRPGRVAYFVSKEALPETPVINLLGKGVSDDSFNATWNAPLVPNGRIRRYRVYYTVDRNEPLSRWSLVYAGRTWKIIRRLEEHQVYFFKIQVVGYAGVGPMSTEVGIAKTQAGVPGQITYVRAATNDSQSIAVSWKDPVYLGNGLDGYEVNYKDSGSWKKQPVEFGQNRTVLSKLSPYTTYTFTVSAKSFSGVGPPSEPIQAKTLEDKPSGAPQGSRARPRSSTSIEVFWQPPLERLQNGKITGYNIMYTHIITATPKILSVDASRRSAMLTGLRKFTRYTIWVTSTNSKGEGPPSNRFELLTDEDVPDGAPKDIRVQALNHSAISVRWKEPTEKSGRIRGYFVYYLHVKDDFQIFPHKTLPDFYDTDSSLDRHAVVSKNVQPSTTYRITVAAYTLKGDGARSLPVYVKTPKFLPPAPVIRRAVLVRPPQGTGVKLSWKPEIPGVRRYKIVYGKALLKFDNLADERSVYVRVSRRTKIFNNLDYGVWYCFKVSQETSVDWSSESRVWIRTPEGKPKGPPLGVKAITGSATSIKVGWASPDPWLRHGKIIKYVVKYKKVAGGEERSKELLMLSANTRLAVVVNGLQVNTRYSFRVTAVTKVGGGPYSVTVTSQTDNQDLPVVNSISIEDLTGTTVLIKWDPPAKQPGFTIIGYKVTVAGSKSYQDQTKATRTVKSSNEKVIKSPLSSAYFDTLKPFLFYTVSIRIETSSGTGERKAKQFKTPSFAPPKAEPPRGVQTIDNKKISVILSPSSEINGPISFYHLCVVDYGQSRSHVATTKNTDKARQRRSLGSSKTYVTAEFKSGDLPRTVLVGDGNKIGGYENRRLLGGHTYRLFVRAYVRLGSKYVNSTSSLTQPVTLPLLTTTVDPKIQGKSAPQKAGGSSNSGVVVAVPIIAILLVIVIVVAIIFVRRRRRKNRDVDEETSKTLLKGKNGSISHGDKPKDLVQLHRIAHPTNGMKTHPPIPVGSFAAHLNSLKSNYETFNQEYESINPGQSFVSEESNQPYNKYKNRYPSLLAYDHTRVVLSHTEEPGSDYLNGNFIDGYCTKKEYIATQGPLTTTISDFWRACWEYNSSTIVMMTKLEERGRNKCEQYWPSSGKTVYGNIQVNRKEQLELATYTRRTFEVSEVNGSEVRIVKQFQFTAWPDPEVPSNPGPLLAFIRRVRKENTAAAAVGPMIVHCSAGVGKTGCFIAIDSMLQRIANDNTVDIYGYVTMMRSQRNFMIQSDEQYIFVHDAIMDAIASGSTEITANNLLSHFKHLTDFNGKGEEYMEDDFKVIVECTIPDPENSTIAHLPNNREKNRCQTIVPYDFNRVCLHQLRGNEGSDYVNASFIDGYKERKAYIAAQGPLEKHTEEFWRMIMENNCSIIVMLTNLEEKDKEMCHKYWPTEKSERYYYYVIEPVNETRHLHFCVREFKVTDARDGEARTIRQFQYINWPKNGVPLASEGIIELIGQVNKLNSSGPILCHSNTGAGRTGVFIALSIVLERLQLENLIDIHQTVKTLRMERAYLVQTVDQYRFCFQVAVDYLRNFEMVV